MTYSFCILFLLCSWAASAQELITRKDIVYGQAVNRHNQVVELKLDIVYPSRGTSLPLFANIHGGRFEEGSNKEGMQSFCERLAQSGFVVANVEYRTGFERTADYKTEISKAVYRAEQDLLAAVRFLVHHAADYRIDTSAIFLGGESAGGVATLFTAYVTQDDWERSAPGLAATLGPLDRSGNALTDRFRIKGAISMWGGIADTALIAPAEMQAVPVLLFHSTTDDEIPFEHVAHPEARQQLLQGSRDVAYRFQHHHGCYQLHFIQGAGHGYGFSSDYIAAAISSFVSGVRKGQCTSREVERPARHVTASVFETDQAAFANEDDRVIHLSPALLQQYAGTYQGQGTVATVSVQGDHLQARAAGGEPNELYPLSQTLFLNKKYNIRVEFVKDSAGKVTEHIVRLSRDRELHYRKVE